MKCKFTIRIFWLGLLTFMLGIESGHSYDWSSWWGASSPTSAAIPSAMSSMSSDMNYNYGSLARGSRENFNAAFDAINASGDREKLQSLHDAVDRYHTRIENNGGWEYRNETGRESGWNRPLRHEEVDDRHSRVDDALREHDEGADNCPVDDDHTKDPDLDPDPDEEPDNQPAAVARQKRTVQLKITPAIYANVDFSFQREAEEAQPIPVEVIHQNKLLLADPNNSTIARGSFQYGLGVGVLFRVLFEGYGSVMAAFTPTAAIIPVVGEKVSYTKHFPNGTSDMPVDVLKIPKNMEDVRKWQVGDSMTWKVEAGAIMFLGISFYGAGFGAFRTDSHGLPNSPEEILQEWPGATVVTITRISSDLVQFDISDHRTSTYGGYFSLAGLVGYTKSKTKQKVQRGKIFKFLLNPPPIGEEYDDEALFDRLLSEGQLPGKYLFDRNSGSMVPTKLTSEYKGFTYSTQWDDSWYVGVPILVSLRDTTQQNLLTRQLNARVDIRDVRFRYRSFVGFLKRKMEQTYLEMQHVALEASKAINDESSDSACSSGGGHYSDLCIMEVIKRHAPEGTVTDEKPYIYDGLKNASVKFQREWLDGRAKELRKFIKTKEEGRRVEIEYGTYRKAKELSYFDVSEFGFIHENAIKEAFGAYHHSDPWLEIPEVEGLYGRFSLSVMDEKSDYKLFQENLGWLKFALGLPRLFDMQLPSKADQGKLKGFSQVEFKLDFSEAVILNLVQHILPNFLNQPDIKQRFIDAGLNKMNGYFSGLGEEYLEPDLVARMGNIARGQDFSFSDPFGICRVGIYEIPISIGQLNRKKIASCKLHYTKQVTMGAGHMFDAAKKLYKALSDIGYTGKLGNQLLGERMDLKRRHILYEISHLMKAMMMNPFTFKLGMALVQNDVTAMFVVKAKSLARVRVGLASVSENGKIYFVRHRGAEGGLAILSPKSVAPSGKGAILLPAFIPAIENVVRPGLGY